MSIALYMRVSKGRGQDTASQEPDLRRWAEARGEPSAWYSDKATGKTMDRPGMDRLLAAVASGQVGTIVVWRLDRLGRTAKGLVSLFDDLQARRVNLVSIKDGLDLSTPAGRLMANVLASVAAYETEVRAERIHAGLEVDRAKGVKLGRPKLRGEGKGARIKVKPEQEDLARRLKGEGKAVAAIARATGLSRPTVYSILAG